MTTLTPRDALEVVRNRLLTAADDFDRLHDQEGWKPTADLLREAAQALVERTGEPVAWMPIETAPKDRPVIVSNGEAVGEASYHESDNGWWWAGYHPTDAADGYVWQPTHWQPLPAAPGASHER